MTGAVAVALVAGLLGLLTSLWVQRQQTRAARNLEEFRTDEQRRRDEAERSEQRRREEVERDEQRRQDEDLRKRSEDERRRTVQGRLDAFREPLLRSTDDLHDRIVNIREWGFLGYLSHPDQWRKRLTMLGTLYRFGRYWATVEALYREVNPLRFETSRETRAVASALRDVARTFASDEHGMDLMVWRDEQRAIGELLLRDAADGRVPVLSFVTFVECYQDSFATWFGGLEHALMSPGIESNQRLADLQEALAHLNERLQAGRDLAL